MKKYIIIFALIIISVIICDIKPLYAEPEPQAERQYLKFVWSYEPTIPISGFLLYMEGESVCDVTDPNALQWSCTIIEENGIKTFWMTAYTSAGVESDPSNTSDFELTGESTKNSPQIINISHI